MTTIYTFPVLYTKIGVATAPASPPTVQVVDKDNNILVAALTAVTAITNMPGAYFYSYSGADGLTCWALFHTSDATVDQQDLASYTPSLVYIASAEVTAIKAKTDNLPSDPADQIAVEAAIIAATTTLTTLGSGAISWLITITVSGLPIDGVDVWVTTDEGGTNVIARGSTDDNGGVTFWLDAGTYYAWKQRAGYSFTNPEGFTVN